MNTRQIKAKELKMHFVAVQGKPCISKFELKDERFLYGVEKILLFLKLNFFFKKRTQIFNS